MGILFLRRFDWFDFWSLGSFEGLVRVQRDWVPEASFAGENAIHRAVFLVWRSF